ncbi:MAG: circadian clock KaiB family protein [Anaerolineae bacterium]|nr:circadian clock KaiB family protein [Anaerolineae bacterium]
MSSYLLKLYVAGYSPTTDEVIATVRRVCEENLPSDCELLVINVLETPEVAVRDKVLATPTLIREYPLPVRRLVGDLTDKRVVLKALELEN